jgi:hypothetical protein
MNRVQGALSPLSPATPNRVLTVARMTYHSRHPGVTRATEESASKRAAFRPETRWTLIVQEQPLRDCDSICPDEQTAIRIEYQS